MSGWKHNDTFRIKNCADIEFLIQDEYKLMANEKWSRVRQVIELSMHSSFDSTKTWCFNYCSAQKWPVQPPRYIAWVMNKSLSEYLNSDSCKCMGIIILDFASKSLIEHIFMLNFRKNI